MGETSLLDDPLRGGGVPIASNASTTNSARGVADVTPPGTLPPANGPTSPAALTNGAGALAAPPAQAGTAVGVTVGGPRAAATSRLTPIAATSGPGQPAEASNVVPAGGVVPAPAADGSYEQLQQQLLARGVTWQQLKTGATRDEWIFVCTIPQPRENNIERHYEARAVGPFGLAAIRAAIKEIDDDNGGH
jgi:hypothetical protein